MTLKVEHRVDIDRPIEEVFAYSSDPLKQTDWQNGLIRVEADSPMAVGTVTTEVRKVMGREMETQMECVTFDPPNKFISKSLSGPVEMTFTQSLESSGQGTQIHVVVEGEPGGFFGVAGPILKKFVQNDVEKDYAKLKEVLEA